MGSLNGDVLDELAGAGRVDAVRDLLCAAGAPAFPAAVAGLAQRCLRAVDKAGLLDLDTVLSAGALVLAGPVKSLAKAQLVWFGTLATREPARLAEILETAAIALDHPAPELRERARTLIEQHTARPGPGAAGVPSNRPEAFLPVPAGERPLS